MFSRYLKQAGFHIETAESAAIGMDVALNGNLDCILLDCCMPAVGGIDMLRKLKSDPLLKFIPVIMLTGLEDEDAIVEGLDAGADDYVGKSNSAKIIIARVKAALRVKRLQDEVKRINETLCQINSELSEANEAKTTAINQLDKAVLDLRELSIRDSLTMLYNHGYLWERLDVDVMRSERYQLNICCLMLDIDYFKKINDNSGHIFGDKILLELAKCMQKCLREIDFISRYGGEEFAILLSDTDYENAFLVAERLRNYIESYEFKIDGGSTKLTVSIGISSLFEDAVFDKEKFLGFADAALYEAKLRGRNTVVMYKELSNIRYLNQTGFNDIESKMSGIAEISKQSYLESVKTLIVTLEERDSYTREHSLNVLRYSAMVAKVMGLAENEIALIGNAAILHDLGKIVISDQILCKKDKLTEDEYALIKKHPLIAVRILKKSNYMKRELQIILYHHERYDGKGYPVGLKGKKIPLGARIIAVCDSYDAMRSARPYREALPINRVISELVDNAGSQFDPEVVDAFLRGLANNELLPAEVDIKDVMQKIKTKIEAEEDV
ncbi:MAG: diguanylate cyclase [Candidatus Omnitrophica bacterium]|nr:diguanylate cyclase [Candidatus Omnitrophota bacterium]